MINIYSQQEIETLKKSGAILSNVLRTVSQQVQPGISTLELNEMAEKLIREAGGEPAFLGYEDRNKRRYPASLCTSVNEELVHCLPQRDKKLRVGDIVSLDLGVRFQGMHTDMAVTVPVGSISAETEKLVRTTRESLEKAIQILKPGITIGDIGNVIQRHAESQGFSVIRDLVGHGVGYAVHEDPKIPNFGRPGTGLKLRAGMVLAIEPMLAVGSYKIKTMPDGWGIAMADGSLSAHFEKTVALTEKGCIVLTP